MTLNSVLEKQDQALSERTLRSMKPMPKQLGEGVGFERTRRITGYLVGTLDRFNNAKRCEEKERVKHG